MFQITIDGPTGSGKTSVAKKVAEMLGIMYFDADLLTSAIALKCVQSGANPTTESEVKEVLDNNNFELAMFGSTRIVKVNNENVTGYLRNQLVVRGQYSVSKLPCVLDYISKKQQEMAASQSVVVDGFNTAKTVFPQAKYKFFLDADVDVRAKRKYDNLVSNGVNNMTFDQVYDDILDTDRNVFVGEASKMSFGEDAHIIDTSENTATDTANIICDIVRKGENL